MSAIVVGIFHVLAQRPSWKGRDLVWYEDNAVVLSAMVKGKSRSEKLDIASMVAHLALAMLNCRVWFEYVESDANWMDEASRVAGGGPWAQRNGFAMSQVQVPVWPWQESVAGMIERVRTRLVTTGVVL